MFRCEKCGSYVDTILICNTGKICDQCHIEENPLKMRLVMIEGIMTKPLYNLTFKSYEDRVTMEDFIACGWFLRQMRQKNGYTFYDLEFRGTTRCGRFMGARFPIIYPRCIKSAICRSMMTRKAYPESLAG